MSNDIEIKELKERSRHIILNTCNTVGCSDCDLKWDGGCASVELENKISDLEYPEFKQQRNGVAPLKPSESQRYPQEQRTK